jgi:uncharacterized Fe-S cluster-containing radical SAM superfamily protein
MYITLQKNAGSNSRSYDRTIAIQYCGKRPFELALRFANCSLRCGPCFAAGYSWSNLAPTHNRVIQDPPIERVLNDFNSLSTPSTGSYNWLRILGGEPLLDNSNIDFLFDFIIEISKIDGKKFNNGVIIQTNGLHIGRENIELLEKRLEELYHINPEILIVIETSIKGTNPYDFAKISQCNEALYEYNINSYYILKSIEAPNIRPTIVAGFGISESYLLNNGNSNRRVAIIGKDDNIAFHPNNWDEEFKKLYLDFINCNKTPFSNFEKMPMYGIGDSDGWQKRARIQAKRIYNDEFIFCFQKDLNPTYEHQFSEILEKFFLVNNQEYYSTLISM